MISLEEKLKTLRESKEGLKRKVRQLRVKNKSLSKESKIGKDAANIDRCMVGHIKENLRKEHLNSFSNTDVLYCPVTYQRMYVRSCLARTFLEGHPRHKACEKCEELYSYIVNLLKEINKKETTD